MDLILSAMAPRRKQTELPVFGRNLSTLRKEKGWSQKQLADLLGTTRANIEYYENRAYNPTLEFVQRASDLFGVSVAKLAGENEPKPKKKTKAKSKLEDRFERVRELPRREQEVVIRMLDGLLESAS